MVAVLSSKLIPMVESMSNKTSKQSGIITIEILIALGLIVTVISAVIMVVFSNQTLAADSQTNQEALALAQAEMEKAQKDARNDYSSVADASLSSVDVYNRKIVIDPASVTQCSKDVISNVNWLYEGRNLSVDLRTRITDVQTALALGGTCDTTPPPLGGWNPPETWNCDNFNPGIPTGLDAMDRIVYMTADKAPFLHIADTNGVPKNEHCHTTNLFVNFSNGFNAGIQLNDVAVARLSDGQIYAFVARNDATNQLEVINVNDIHNPFSVGKFSLAGVDPSGSSPEGWRVYYFNNRLYVLVRETAGPEFHIFNVSNSSSIFEIGSGTELNTTVESIVLTLNSGKTIAYMAADSNSRELIAYDVTNSSSISEILAARQNLAGNQDGAAVYYLNDKIYFGRMSSSGADLYVFDASEPFLGLPILQQADIGTNVIDVVVSGPYLFIATTKANAEFQVWTSDSSKPIVKVDITGFNFPNITTFTNGMKYENGWIYLASKANDALRILYDGQ